MEHSFVYYLVITLTIIAAISIIIWADYKITKSLKGKGRDTE